MADDLSLGEIGRSVTRIEAALVELRAEVRQRHHTLANSLTVAVAPISVHTIQIESQQKNLERLDEEVKDVTKQANIISGAGAVLAVIAGLIPWPWKH